MILIADAQALLDLQQVGALTHLRKLGEIKILDVLQHLCDDDPEVLEHIQKAEITVIQSSYDWSYVPFMIGGLRYADALGLYYAKQTGDLLLAGDRIIQQSCKHHKLPFRHTLWSIQELYRKNHISKHQLEEWLANFTTNLGFVSSEDIKNLRRILL